MRREVVGAVVGALSLYLLYSLLGDPAVGPETAAVPGSDQRQIHPALGTRSDSVFVISDPIGATVVLDWENVGPAPLMLGALTERKLLVVFKPGYLAVSRAAGSIAGDTIRLALEPDTLPAVGNAIVLAEPALAAVVRRLIENLGYPAQPEPFGLARVRAQAGGSLTPAMMSWARAQWRARLFIAAEERSVARDLGEQNLPDRVRGAVAGTYVSDVALEATVFDLREGVSLGSAHGTGRGSAGDATRATGRAREEALSRLAHALARLVSKLEHE